MSAGDTEALMGYDDVLAAYDPALGLEVHSDEEILEYVRKDAVSVYHPTSTCKMGTDALSVVDPALKVHGIDGLRVADASIMPTIVSGNTHAACVVIADKCADMILSDRRTVTAPAELNEAISHDIY